MRMGGRCFYLSVLMWLLLLPRAHAFDAGMPIACQYGEECFISSYFPHKAKDDVMDYTCGGSSREGEIGTRFILRNMLQLQPQPGSILGDVIAVDAGIVQSARNDEVDIPMGSGARGDARQSSHACGNGVVLKHGSRGFMTHYCHLQEGSVLVKPGQEVVKGQKLGRVGLSGVSDYPHLEFIVTKDGAPIDPFMGELPLPCKSMDAVPLWDEKTLKLLTYASTVLLNAGFSVSIPNVEGAKSGRFFPKTLPRDAKMLLFWVDLMGMEKGDRMELSVTGPDGDVISQKERTFADRQPMYFQYLGKKRPGSGWKTGKYTGNIRVIRGLPPEEGKREEDEQPLSVQEKESIAAALAGASGEGKPSVVIEHSVEVEVE